MIRHVAVSLWLMAALLGSVPASAQYMFLDFDGDGQYTAFDTFGTLPGSGHVDVYVITDSNGPYPDPAVCHEDGSGIGINGYAVNLLATGPRMHVTGVENRMAGMSALFPPVVTSCSVTASYFGGIMYPPGKYLLLTLDVQFEGEGCASLNIVTATPESPPEAVTGIWSNCSGLQYDSILRLGEDWFAVDNIQGCYAPATPAVICPSPITIHTGEPVTLTATVDSKMCSGGVESYGASGLPGGALGALTDLGNGMFSLPFSWTPTSAQAGTYTATFTALNHDYFNSRDLIGSCATTVTVLPSNQPPTASAGGPYRGLQSVPVSFDASLSSDPDGDNLTYLWEYGDGATGTGGAPLHTYATAGVFTVVLHATDPGGLSDLDSTTATIARDLPVRVFSTSSNDPTKLGRGKPVTCFQVEAIDGAFTPDQIVSSSVFLRYTDPVCGELEIYTGGTKTATVSDTDKNGVQDYSACFSREGMQTIGMCMPKGTQTVTLELYGSLTTGERIHGQVEHTFISTGALQVAITPNPVNAASRVEFVTRRAGPLAVRVFDIRGRLVATLMEEPAAQPGRHQVTFADLDRSGVRLASGIYFVRVLSQNDGEETRRITILK